jgi:hypothetical protein
MPTTEAKPQTEPAEPAKKKKKSNQSPWPVQSSPVAAITADAVATPTSRSMLFGHRPKSRT